MLSLAVTLLTAKKLERITAEVKKSVVPIRLMVAILQDMKIQESLHIIIIKGIIFDALKLWMVVL